VEKGELAVAMLELLEIELGDVLEGVGTGHEGDARTLLEPVLVTACRDLRRVPGNLERLDRDAVLEAHRVLLAVAPDDQLEPLAERVDDGHADPVKAARNLIGIVVAGVL